jgi:hypothetical protein
MTGQDAWVSFPIAKFIIAKLSLVLIRKAKLAIAQLFKPFP